MGHLRPWRAWMFLFLLLAGMTLLAAWRLGLWKAARATAPVEAWEEAKVSAGTDEQRLVAANNAFALDLYGRLKGTSPNLFFSPYSLSTSLSMTLAGARGETERQIRKVLRLDLPPERLHPAAASLAERIARAGKGPRGDGGCEVAVANALWRQKGHPFLPEFLALGRQRYGAFLEEADFATAAADACRRIDGWFEEKTRKRIRNLVTPGAIDGRARLVLANAVYFKGAWGDAFETEATLEGTFRLADGGSVRVPFMHKVRAYPYWEGPGLQALELPYGLGDFSMLILLPRRRDDLSVLESLLTPGRLAAVAEGLSSREAKVYLPRFRIEPPTSRLESALAALGMEDALSPEKADFSGIDGRRPPGLFLSAVLQKAFVDVDEKGTEAAAATAVVAKGKGKGRSPAPPVFRADRPFLFLIRHRETGTILFMGRVANPNG